MVLTEAGWEAFLKHLITEIKHEVIIDVPQWETPAAAHTCHLLLATIPARPQAQTPSFFLFSPQQRKGGPTRLTLPSKSTVRSHR